MADLTELMYLGSDYEQITVADTAVGFSAAKLATQSKKAVKAHVRISNADIRYRVDGTNPDANTGMPGLQGEQFVLSGPQNLVNFRAIRSGSSNATLDVIYYYWYA